VANAKIINSKVLTLDQYLMKVRGQNGLYKIYEEKIISSKLKIKEKDLLTSPSVFADSNYTTNYKKSTEKDLTYDHKNDVNYDLGIKQDSDFGLNGKLYYNLKKTTFVDPDPETTGNRSTGTMEIELEQNLLKNSFGQVTRANKKLIENQNMANYYSGKYNSKQLLQDAENTYWNLVVMNEITQVKLATVKQNQEMENYTLKKVKMNLMDRSNELQSRAALELGRLNLQEAKDNQKDMIRLFNSLIGIDSDDLDVELVEIPWNYLETYKTSKEYQPTAQLKSLEKQVNAIKANSVIDKNKYKPTLNLVANYSLNRENDRISNTYVEDDDTPTKYIGINFSAPLNFSAVKSFNESTYKDQNAIKLQYKQQLLNDKVSWNQLLNKLSYAQERLKLAKKIEEIQDIKLKNEIKRWKNGISSTYQVLQFQTELTESRLNSLNIANEIFNIIANLKLFEVEE
ncbi:MAG: TolC family protein, partial [Rickettsiales bacterium]|nr:TolC family protein [Rickettsiales bacterium]